MSLAISRPISLFADRSSPDATTQELAAKLNSEIALEKEQQADDSYRYNCQEYIDNSEFKIEDKAGTEEVHLTRQYGDEKFDTLSYQYSTSLLTDYL